MTRNTELLLEEFKRCGIDYEIIWSELNYFHFKAKDGKWHIMCGMVSDHMPATSHILCKEKYLTYKLFLELGLPTPATIYFTDCTDEFLTSYSPLIIKPSDSAQGRGIKLNITDVNGLNKAVKDTGVPESSVLLQQQIEGADLRLLIIGGKLISAVERRPTQVIGDRKHTVRELIYLENQRPEREDRGTSRLRQISMEACKSYLTESGFQQIPNMNEAIRVSGPANQSLGGSVHPASDLMTDKIKTQAESIAQHINAPIAGVDCILNSNGEHYFIEINSSPGIGIHDDSFWGTNDKSYEQYAQWLFEH
ncbi:MAG: ATP-grasp domain-containing protein [bacterium]|nr:ATP-grasp domain-containing protein [bacterium]